MAITKDKAIEIMTERGYTLTSEAGNGTWVGFGKDISGVWLSAKVLLEKETVDIQGGPFKLACELFVKSIDIFNNRFADFEKWMYFYSRICTEVEHVVEELDFVPKRVYSFNNDLTILNSPKEVKKETLEDRILKFKKKVIRTGKEKGYDSQMCKAFFSYWSEVNDNGKKMRWEIAKTKGGVFNIDRRMVTWAAKDQEYNARFLDRDEKKAKKQNEEMKVRNKINTKELF